jgi:hypothetical protein
VGKTLERAVQVSAQPIFVFQMNLGGSLYKSDITVVNQVLRFRPRAARRPESPLEQPSVVDEKDSFSIRGLLHSLILAWAHDFSFTLIYGGERHF